MTEKAKKKPAVLRGNSQKNLEFRLRREESAVDAIGELVHGCSFFIMTFGQFSMIDVLAAILRQTGPADVTVSSWTAGDYDLERSAYLLEDGSIRSIRFLLDRSIVSRRKALYGKYLERVFSADSIRGVRNHSKMLLVRSDTHDVVVRGSMNLNTNPNLENLDISENHELAEFLQKIFDSIWEEVGSDERPTVIPEIKRLPRQAAVKEVRSYVVRRESLREPRTTHVVRRPSRRSV